MDTDKRRRRAKLKRKLGTGKLNHNRPGFDPKREAREQKRRAVQAARKRAESRECGSCQMCCVVLGIPTIKKPAWKSCPNLCTQGCGIYAERPNECSSYLCFWRQGYGAENDRPDDLGVVMGIESMPMLVQIAVGQGVPRITDEAIVMRAENLDAFKSARVRGHVRSILRSGGVCVFVHEREGVTVFGPACPQGFYLPRASMEAWNKEAALKRGVEPKPVFRDDFGDDATVVEVPEDVV